MKGDINGMTTYSGFSLSSYGFCTFSQICLPNFRGPSGQIMSAGVRFDSIRFLRCLSTSVSEQSITAFLEHSRIC
jgi:hypothetical protein